MNIPLYIPPPSEDLEERIVKWYGRPDYWNIPAIDLDQMQTAAREGGDPEVGALADRYLQGFHTGKDFSNFPENLLSVAGLVSTGLAGSGYEQLKTVPLRDQALNILANVLELVSPGYGQQFRVGKQGTVNATSPPSLANIEALLRGYVKGAWQ